MKCACGAGEVLPMDQCEDIIHDEYLCVDRMFVFSDAYIRLRAAARQRRL